MGLCLSLHTSLLPAAEASYCESASLEWTACPDDLDAGLLSLDLKRRDRPFDFRAHTAYQDRVRECGIEGHLRRLTEDYQIRLAERPDDLLLRYLYARTLVGRSTRSAIAALREILVDSPTFAPAEASLALAYSSEAFRDDDKAAAARERFLSLCPGSELKTDIPTALPRFRKIAEAEALLDAGGEPDVVEQMGLAGLKEEEHAWQRARAFDWYRDETKRALGEELKASYWRVWGLQVRCDWRAGRRQRASARLASMEERSRLLKEGLDSVSWDANMALVLLYAEGREEDKLRERLRRLRAALEQRPDPARAARLETLLGRLAGDGSPANGAP